MAAVSLMTMHARMKVGVAAFAVMALGAVAGCGGGDDATPAEKAVRAALPGAADESPAPVSWRWQRAEYVFTVGAADTAEIFLGRGVDTVGVNLTTSETGDVWPVWSPDGTRIAFQRATGEEGRFDIFVMNADGSGVTQLTDHPADDTYPSWTPDGARITFVSWRQETSDSVKVRGRIPRSVNHLYIMNADGSDQRRFVAASPGGARGVSWAPDGEALVMARKDGDQGADIFIVSPAGDDIRRLTNDEASNGAPVFSPDGRFVAYHADHGERSEIVVSDRWALERRVVVAEGTNRFPRFSPDGTWIIYTAVNPDGPRGNRDVMAVAIDGGTPVRLTRWRGSESEASWRPVR